MEGEKKTGPRQCFPAYGEDWFSVFNAVATFGTLSPPLGLK